MLLDEHLCFGEENEITVIADNSAVPNSRWYSGSGIYRNVSLYSGESSHILPDGLLISTLNNDIVNVKVSASGGDEICVKIYDGDSVAAESVAPVSEGTAEVSLPACGTQSTQSSTAAVSSCFRTAKRWMRRRIPSASVRWLGT